MSTAAVMKASTLKTSANRAMLPHLTNKSSQWRERGEYFRNRNENGSVGGNGLRFWKGLKGLGLTGQSSAVSARRLGRGCVRGHKSCCSELGPACARCWTWPFAMGKSLCRNCCWERNCVPVDVWRLFAFVCVNNIREVHEWKSTGPGNGSTVCSAWL